MSLSTEVKAPRPPPCPGSGLASGVDTAASAPWNCFLGYKQHQHRVGSHAHTEPSWTLKGAAVHWVKESGKVGLSQRELPGSTGSSPQGL